MQGARDDEHPMENWKLKKPRKIMGTPEMTRWFQRFLWLQANIAPETLGLVQMSFLLGFGLF